MVNQYMGPGGPGGDTYDPNKNKPVVTYSTAANNAAAAQAALQNVIDNKNQSQAYSTAPGVVAIPTMGKKTGKFKDIEEKLSTQGYGSLTPGEQMIADFYLSSAVNPYQQQLQNFIESSPAAAQAYAERFPKTTFLKNLGPMAMGSVTGVPLGIVNAISKGYGAAKEGLGSLAERDDVLGMLASIPGNVAAQFTPSQAENVKNIAKERAPINTLQTGPMDPNAYGAIGGDRFDVEEDIFQSTFPNDPRIGAQTVYTPDANPYPVGTMEYVRKQNELMKEKYGKENIAKEVEEATESIVPGEFNLNYVRPDAPAINLSGVTETEETTANPEFMGFNDPNYINMMNEYEQSQLGEGTSKMTPNTNFALLDPNVNPEVPFTEYTDPFLMPPQSSMQSIPMNASGGYLNKFDDGGYANMSTYQKLKMMADSLG
jgi:hypothetical protein|tara:strand:+ start:1903 stop:3189 length:1287 start_codon:yes stop_codon:yes gene_type:complete